MQPLVVGLILASALLHALWNAILKRQPEPEVAAVAILAVATILAASVVPFTSGPTFPHNSGIPWSVAAGLCEAAYFLTLALGLRHAPLGVVYAITRGGALVLVWPVSVLLLGEQGNALSLAGVAVVTAGLMLVGHDSRGGFNQPGLAWAVLCAACVAGYHLCYKCALATGAHPAAVFAVALGVALPLNIARLGRAGLPRVVEALRTSPWVLGVAGITCAASFLIFLAALAQGGAGAVVTLRNTSVVFALLLAWLIGERPGHRNVIGTLGVALGAVLLGWPRP
jgi:drug/metabolite transporter (DMT)-like permease